MARAGAIIGICLSVNVIPYTCSGGEGTMLNLAVPGITERGRTRASFIHRFQEPVDHRLGVNGNANTGVLLKVPIRSTLELNAGYVEFRDEYVFGVSMADSFPDIMLDARFEIQYSSVEGGARSGRVGDFVWQLAFQMTPLRERMSAVINAIYDNYDGQFGLGLGVNIRMAEGLAFLWEYFPHIYEEDVSCACPLTSDILGDTKGSSRSSCCSRPKVNDTFAVGFGLQVWDYDLFLLVGNSWEIGTRHLMRGTYGDDLYLGLNVHRWVHR